MTDTSNRSEPAPSPVGPPAGRSAFPPVTGGLRQSWDSAAPDRSGQGEIPPALALAGHPGDAPPAHMATPHLGRTVGLRAGLSISAAVTLGILFAAGLAEWRGGDPASVVTDEPWYGSALPAPAEDGTAATRGADGLSLLAAGQPWPEVGFGVSCAADRYALRPDCGTTPRVHETGTLRVRFRLETASGPAAAAE